MYGNLELYNINPHGKIMDTIARYFAKDMISTGALVVGMRYGCSHDLYQNPSTVSSQGLASRIRRQRHSACRQVRSVSIRHQRTVFPCGFRC